MIWINHFDKHIVQLSKVIYVIIWSNQSRHHSQDSLRLKSREDEKQIKRKIDLMTKYRVCLKELSSGKIEIFGTLIPSSG